MHRSTSRAFAAAFVLFLHCLVPGAHAAPAADDKIAPDLLATLAPGGEAAFFVILKDRADLATARVVKDREAQGRLVQQSLAAVARSSQAGVVGLLAGRGIPHQAFYIVNAVRVVADLATARELAGRAEVERVVPEREHPLPRPSPGQGQAAVQAVEWNVARIGADRVWSELGVTGEGIVVGNIDTGVDFQHPALTRSYRGNAGNGTFAHDYNWWDPTGICGSSPCDNDAHGTHTMGTIVGGDGNGPFGSDVGVAPGARWIAAKGCEYDSCSDGALLSAAQFMLAPTDSAGNAPDPSRRPHVVNNSWGGFGGDPFYSDVLEAWTAAGIFPVFSAGNAGEFGCTSAGSPGDNPLAFAVGATDSNDAIAYFSARGPAIGSGILKPDVSAPGVSVRSSIPGSGYAWFDGTSMAAPHVAGMVALLWSANPALRRDVVATAAAIRSTALDRIDTTCGGAPGGDPNNVYGDGRVDAFAACLQHCGPRGRVEGRVRAASGGGPIRGATVLARRTSDGLEVSVTSAGGGAYAVGLPVRPGSASDEYRLEFRAFGYENGTATVTAVPDVTVQRNIRLTPRPRYTVSGVVESSTDQTPIGGATVHLLDTPLPPQTTDASGAFAFTDVPPGRYGIRATPGVCHEPRRRQIRVQAANVTTSLRVRPHGDAFGHRCEEPDLDWIEGTQTIPYGYPAPRVALPFPFYFYGEPLRAIFPGFTGFLTFSPETPYYLNTALPSPLRPNRALYPFWDDLYSGALRTRTVGERPDRVFVIEYESFFVYPYGNSINFEVLLREHDSAITFQYLSHPGAGDGRSATIGIENADGTDAVQIGVDQPIVRDGLAVRFVPPTIDGDADGVRDQIDLCPTTPDPRQRDLDEDGTGDACDAFDGVLRPTRLQVFRSSSDASPNGRVVVKGEVLLRSAAETLDTTDGLTIAVVDSLQLATRGEWERGECKTSTRGVIRCKRRDVPRDVAELKPLPSDIPGLRTYLLTARLVRRDLDAPFVAPVRVSMANDPGVPLLGVDRVGTPLDCQARAYGLECLTGREGSTSRAFLVKQPAALVD